MPDIRPNISAETAIGPTLPPSVLSANSILFVRKFAAFLDLPPSSADVIYGIPQTTYDYEARPEVGPPFFDQVAPVVSTVAIATEAQAGQAQARPRPSI